MKDLDKDTPIFLTGGETGCGEALRGRVLHIDFDDAAESLVYTEQVIHEAKSAEAPDQLIKELEEIAEGHRIAGIGS